MTKLEEAISMAAREMSYEARLELCQLLVQDLDQQKAVDEAWSGEIKRRLEAMDRGEGSSRLSDEVVARLRKKQSA